MSQLTRSDREMSITISQLGLAAYVKMMGANLVSIEDKKFVFESDLTVSEWRVRYNNSCCMKHDTLVCEMRHHMKD